MIHKLNFTEYQHIKLPENLEQVWRDENYLVQIFKKQDGVIRLSIMSTQLDNIESISWETLQRLKKECGFGNFDAIEIFPCEKDIVNIANMRHLWILNKKISFAWRKQINPELSPQIRQQLEGPFRRNYDGLD